MRAPDPLGEVVARLRSALAARPTPQPFGADVELVGSGTEVSVRAGDHRLTVDEPRAAGGTDRGPNPIDLALASLGSCQLITYQLHAARLGLRITSLRVGVDAELDMGPVFGLDACGRAGTVSVRVEIEGPEPADRYEELHMLVENSCPVRAMTRGSVAVHTDLVVNP